MTDRMAQVEQWGIFEANWDAPDEGNPYQDTELAAEFRLNDRSVTVGGFYDGSGRYRIRFMPDETGEWGYETFSNRKPLDGRRGAFRCLPPSAGNRGPVRVSGDYHFAYADGTAYYPIGTTSYGWAQQKEELAGRTLDALRGSPFNKLRMCALPHYSAFSERHIACFPFPGEPPAGWDFSRMNPDYFRMLDLRLQALLELGIQADLILFHPYQRPWKFDAMGAKAEDAYVRYVVNRYGAYRHVWWSIANEFDFIQGKTPEDWDRICRLMHESDPYGRLCSIHNGYILYEHWKPWITHASVQDSLAVTRPGRAVVLRNAYRKPVVYDEVGYEGNLPFYWGDLSPEELTHRLWQGAVEGTYVGHGEVLRPAGMPIDRVWTGIGGTLGGRSVERFAFFRKVLEEGPNEALNPVDEWRCTGIAGIPGSFYLLYFGKASPTEWRFELPCRSAELPEGAKFVVERIDAWNMTIERCEETFECCKANEYVYKDIYNRAVALPGKPFVALRITRLPEEAPQAADS